MQLIFRTFNSRRNTVMIIPRPDQYYSSECNLNKKFPLFALISRKLHRDVPAAISSRGQYFQRTSNYSTFINIKKEKETLTGISRCQKDSRVSFIGRIKSSRAVKTRVKGAIASLIWPMFLRDLSRTRALATTGPGGMI